MKKIIWFLSIFCATFTIGYFVVPTFMKPIEKQEVVNVVHEEIPIQPKSQSQEFIKEIEEAESDSKRKFKIRLLETGEGFHGDQINAKSGQIWLGLFNNDKRFYLKKTKIKIQRVFDEVVDDENKKEKTGKTVKTANTNPSVFMLKNAEFLKEGEVKTFFGGNHLRNEIEENVDYLSLNIGFAKDLIVGGETYSLRVKKGINQKKEKSIALVLESNNISQTLHSLEYFSENDYLGTLNWVGDLDRDNKPDFYFDLYIHDNMADRYLFLSSKANKGKLVEKIANFWTNGC